MICLKYIINSHAAKKVFSYLANYSVPILLVFTFSNMFNGWICYSFIVQLILYIVFNKRVLIFSLVIYCNYLNQKKKKNSLSGTIYLYIKRMCIYYFHVTILAFHTIMATNLRKEILIYTPICSFITHFYCWFFFLAFLDNRKILKILSIYFKWIEWISTHYCNYLTYYQILILWW